MEIEVTEQAWDMAPWKGLSAYTETMQGVVRSWRTFFEGEFSPEHFTKKELWEWSKRLEVTFSTLREQYYYDTLQSVQVHPVASGFPEMTFVRILNSMHQQLKGKENSSASSASLRRLVLDSLFEYQRVNQWLLERTAKARAREILTLAEPIALFKVRSMTQFPEITGRRVYACCFERFCYRHIPSLYLILFEYSGEGEFGGADLQAFLRVIEEDTSNLPLLGRFAERLDLALAPIHPKWVGRISLGPVFIAHTTKDEHQLQQTLNEYTPPGELAAVSRIIYEYVMSEKEYSSLRLFDSRGQPHTILQDFAVKQSDDECRARTVSHVEKFLFAPHNIVQSLSEEFRREIGHTYIGG